MTHRFQWRRVALASAVALLGSVTSIPAQALGLGRITVQSALGEALRAEIEVPEISADEANSLRVGVAGPEAFKAAGLEYSVAVVGVQVSLQKRADGRSYLRLSSTRPVTEPFVDLILQASWASGRVVRDYTMLFDPPTLRQSAAPTAPVLQRAPAPGAAGIASIPYYPSAPPQAQAGNQVITRPAPVTKAPAAQPVQPSRPTVAAKPASSGQQVTVKPGDTAGKLAAQTKPASISLDQMLVALLRSNPDAFIGGNINRLKSGAVLDIPAAQDAAAVSPGEASRTIIAQAKDFNDFRQKLAAGVPGAQVDSANRQAGGKVQAKVEDRATSSATPDKLTLSKGAIQGKAGAEDKLAKDRQAKDASTRVAELAKNIGDLNKLAGVPAVASPSAPPGAASAASAAKVPGVSVGVPVTSAAVAVSAPASASKPATTTATTATTAVTAAPAALAATTTVTTTLAATTTTVTSTATVVTTATATAATASAPAAVASQAVVAASTASAPVAVKKPVVVPPPPPEPSLIDELTENAFVLPALGGLLVLLAGFGFFRYKRRNNPATVDSSFLESRLQPDSFFGASGGQRIDTSEGGGATGSSLVYSSSQLDAAGDVDPVAEADVYLAYGRDLQAEEILKEALRTSPSRVAIHAKLSEIYAKRRDLKGFEVIAADAFTLTRGNGPEWAYISEMGRDLDPANPMYQPGGQPHLAAQAEAAQTPAMAASFDADAVPQMIASSPDAAVDFDLDLDFSVGDDKPAQVPTPAPAPAYQPEQTVAIQAMEEPMFDGLDMDFGADTVAIKPSIETPPDDGLSFSIEPPPTPAPVATAAVIDNGMLEFDMGSLSLDLDAPVTESPTLAKATAVTPTVTAAGPLDTKFALAEEFRALGDMDGARSLAEEVVAQAQGTLRSKAQAFLNALS